MKRSMTYLRSGDRDAIWLVRLVLLGLALLAVWFAIPACAQVSTVAAKTARSIADVEITIAKSAHDAHIAEVNAITDSMRRRSVELGCGESGPLLTGCRVEEWNAARTEHMARLDASKARWHTFSLAMRTLDAAVVKTAEAVDLYLSMDSGGLDLGAILDALLSAWGDVAALLGEYGVSVPKIGGGR